MTHNPSSVACSPFGCSPGEFHLMHGSTLVAKAVHGSERDALRPLTTLQATGTTGAVNGVHDMGGMHGFGPIRPRQNEEAFHAEWEKRVPGLDAASRLHGVYNI